MQCGVLLRPAGCGQPATPPACATGPCASQLAWMTAAVLISCWPPTTNSMSTAHRSEPGGRAGGTWLHWWARETSMCNQQQQAGRQACAADALHAQGTAALRAGPCGRDQACSPHTHAPRRLTTPMTSQSPVSLVPSTEPPSRWISSTACGAGGKCGMHTPLGLHAAPHKQPREARCSSAGAAHAAEVHSTACRRVPTQQALRALRA